MFDRIKARLDAVESPPAPAPVAAPEPVQVVPDKKPAVTAEVPEIEDELEDTKPSAADLGLPIDAPDEDEPADSEPTTPDGRSFKTLRTELKAEKTARLQYEAKVKELLPAGVVWGDVEREVANAFMPLDATFAAQGDVNTASRYRTAGHLLAADFLHSGQAATAAQAAQMSYEKLFSERQVAKRTYRVPLSLPSQGRVIPIDPDAVETGLDSFVANITPDIMAFPVDPGFTAEESFARNLRTVKARSYWANNQTGTGVILMGPNGAQKRPDGKPIEVSFEQAVKLGAGEDAIRAATEKKAKLETSPYSGLR